MSWKAVTDYSDHLANVTLSPKLKSTGTAPDATSFTRWWDAASGDLKDFSPKIRTLWHYTAIKERGALPRLIVVISVRQSTIASNI